MELLHRTMPTHCAVALKEWASVLEAIVRGEQMVLIRKGGLVEPGSGFKLVSDSFVFYPTFEHHARSYLRQPYHRYFDEAVRRNTPEGEVRIELFGIAHSCVQSHEPDVIQRLSDFHVYNETFVSQRLKWQSGQPLTIVLVRAYRLPSSKILPVVSRYAGCKSWVDLDIPLSLEGALPVLKEQEFRERAAAIAKLLP